MICAKVASSKIFLRPIRQPSNRRFDYGNQDQTHSGLHADRPRGFHPGCAPLMQWLNERNWPKSVDEQGLVTRGGTRIAWNEFTRITKVITNIGRTGAKTEHYELRYPKG